MQLNTDTAALGGAGDLIPAGTLVWLAISVRGLTHSKGTGGRQADLEYTVATGQHAKRKVWGYIGDPDDATNSDAYRIQSQGGLVRMLEAAGICKLNDPASYARITSFQQALQELVASTNAGRFVAAKISIEKGKDGYADKNRIADFLSPNPKSASAASWRQLLAPATVNAAKPAAPAPGFALGGGAPVQASAVAPAWGAPPAAALTAPPPWLTQPAATPTQVGASSIASDEIPF
jgi:hypothetical protein